jgi:uncharacterized caspase-like protein
MASRSDRRSIDGRSNEVEVWSDAPDGGGRLHVLALGVSQYQQKDRSLRFADRDAQTIADFLHGHGQRDGDVPGERIVLTDDQVTPDRVDEAFAKLYRLVERRPEDTVVVFLAGHTDVLAQRFLLLLPGFPFDRFAGPDGVARRRNARSEAVLPYSTIDRNLARLGALKRLVIIDACRAEAIHDDPAVRRIQERVEKETHRARTAYLLAARRGEPANEASALEHGLLTYVLLRGMGDPGLEPIRQAGAPGVAPTADRDGDGVITTEELSRYAEEAVPRLASQLTLLAQRAGIDGRMPPGRPAAGLDQEPRLQAEGPASFPIVTVPAPGR